MYKTSCHHLHLQTMTCRRNKLMGRLFADGLTVKRVQNMMISDVAVQTNSYLTPLLFNSPITSDTLGLLELYLNCLDGAPYKERHPGISVSGFLFPSLITAAYLTTRQIKAIKRSNKQNSGTRTNSQSAAGSAAKFS